MKVSVIMPSCRPEMVKEAIRGFIGQDYAEKELIIIDESTTSKAYIAGSIINTIGAAGATIGAKRNIGCSNATGDVFLHMDDDDFYRPDWISRSVDHLLTSGANLTGLSRAYFTDELNAWEYIYKGTQPYVCGATMCYHRVIWERNPFKEIQTGEDLHFCAGAGRIIPHAYKEGFVARIHGYNTASHLQIPGMAWASIKIIKSIYGKT
jgi:glycosyltransferase involved in cell wall biosynthesis